jgi:hypothetical protein
MIWGLTCALRRAKNVPPQAPTRLDRCFALDMHPVACSSHRAWLLEALEGLRSPATFSIGQFSYPRKGGNRAGYIPQQLDVQYLGNGFGIMEAGEERQI